MPKYGASICSALRIITRVCGIYFPEGPGTQYLRSLVPKTIPLMVFGIRVLKHWVVGPPLGCQFGYLNALGVVAKVVLEHITDNLGR